MTAGFDAPGRFAADAFPRPRHLLLARRSRRNRAANPGSVQISHRATRRRHRNRFRKRDTVVEQNETTLEVRRNVFNPSCATQETGLAYRLLRSSARLSTFIIDVRCASSVAGVTMKAIFSVRTGDELIPSF